MTSSDQKHQKLVRNTRTYLRSLAKKRSDGIVTADDANRYLMKQGIRESNIGRRLSVMNSIFRNGDFLYAGVTNSTRAAARGRAISTWEVMQN